MNDANLNKAIKKILFLDIDGVLNAHRQLPSGYCGIDRAKAEWLNAVLYFVPDAKLVISSAWRYMMLRGDMTLKGFEYLLLVHGVNCRERLHGYTEADPDNRAVSFRREAVAAKRAALAGRSNFAVCKPASH